MSKLLDQLYNGELCPMEHTRPRDPEYGEIDRAFSDKRRELARQLSGEKQGQWEELEELYTTLLSTELRSAFGRGFRLGCELMMETREDWPAVSE